jgi:tetratricopeptide (TPR) repeat protein
MRTHPRRGPRVGSLWRAELARGLELQAAGDDEAARTALARAMTMAPGEAEPPFALGRLEERRGRGEAAERHYRRALAARPDWPLAAAALARRLGLRPRPALDEARRVLQAARANEPNHPLLLMVAGELALEEERADEALAAFTAARKAGADPRRVDRALARTHNLAAIALASNGRSDEALFGFKRACALDPTWAAPRVNLGALWQRLGKRQQALLHYRQAVALDAGNGTAQLDLGLLLRERGQLAGAVQAFAAAYRADPPHPRARVELALTLSARGEHARAIALFDEETRLGDGAKAIAYTNLGVAWLIADDFGRAEAALEAALAHDPAHPAALRNLAHLYARSGRLVDAAALMRRAQGNSGAAQASK